MKNPFEYTHALVSILCRGISDPQLILTAKKGVEFAREIFENLKSYNVDFFYTINSNSNECIIESVNPPGNIYDIIRIVVSPYNVCYGIVVHPKSKLFEEKLKMLNERQGYFQGEISNCKLANIDCHKLAKKIAGNMWETMIDIY